MSILGAMNAGTSGLNAEGEALGVVGDNVANTNTVGFKQSRSTFENVLGGAMGSNAAGGGVRMGRVQQIFAQGTMLNTGQPTDIALSGDGFFVVNGTVDGVVGNFYSRAGQMTLRNDGTLVNPQGLALQGYSALPGGGFASSLGDVKLPTGELSPRASTKMTVAANIDATSATPLLAWNAQSPSTTSNFSTSMKVYDSLGNAHNVDVYFRKTGANAWEYHALANGSEVNGGIPGQNFEFGSGTLSFTNTGALQAQTNAGGTVSFNGAAPNQAIAFDFGTSIANGGTGLDGVTQFGSPSNVSAQKQDGYASGALSSVKIDGNGVVQGVYTNGQTLDVSKIAVAKFVSNDGLGKAGHNLWMQTRDSGEPAIGAAGAGGRGAVVSGALEQSNVDISQQFVDMIAHQRSFQANSKTITTADEMLQELVNLKR